MGHKVSTKRADGKMEYPTVSTRGRVVIGIVFYIPDRERLSIDRLEKRLRKVSGKLQWNEAEIFKSEKDGKATVFFPVQFHDEELETAGNELKVNYLKKLEEMDEEIERLEKELADIIKKLDKQSETVWFYAETHSTFT